MAWLPVPLATGDVVEFKWWSGKEWEVRLEASTDFMLYGDAAPNARFNYRYVVPVPRLEGEVVADRSRVQVQ